MTANHLPIYSGDDPCTCGTRAPSTTFVPASGREPEHLRRQCSGCSRTWSEKNATDNNDEAL